MTELINLLQQKVGLNAEQATQSLHTIKEFIVEKFPMLQGAVENIFKTSETPEAVAPAHAPSQHAMLDKISDFIPGNMGQKIEDFAKTAADKAEDFFPGLKGKI